MNTNTNFSTLQMDSLRTLQAVPVSGDRYGIAYPAKNGDGHYNPIVTGLSEIEAKILAASLRSLEAMKAMIIDTEEAAEFNRRQGFHDIAAERMAKVNAAKRILEEVYGKA